MMPMEITLSDLFTFVIMLIALIALVKSFYDNGKR